MSLLDFALLLAPRGFREGYRRQFRADVTAANPSLGETLDVARTGIALRWESVARDARFAVRSLAKARLFTFVSLMTLALAISVNATVFGAIEATLLKPLPFVHPQRLVFLCPNPASSEYCGQMPNVLIRSYQSGARTLSGVAAWQYGAGTLTGHGAPQSLNIAWVSSNFFGVLGVRPELGRALTSHDAQTGIHDVLVSDEFWRRVLGTSPRAIGERLQMDGVSWRIVGIMPPHVVVPEPSDAAPSTYPFDVFKALPESSFRSGNPQLNDTAFARVAPGTGIAAARSDVERITANLLRRHPVQFKGLHVSARPFDAVYYRDTRALLYLALAVAFAVLLIACANVANLLLARGAARSGELAVRSAIGATRAHIVQQLFIEILLLAAGGGVLGLLFAWSELRALTVFASGILPVAENLRLGGAGIAFTFLVVAAAALLAGVLPASVATRYDVQGTLRRAGRFVDTSGTKTFRAGLAVAEIALAFAVIVAAGLLYRSFVGVVAAPQGFSSKNVYVATAELFAPRFTTSAARRRFMAAALKRVESIPGVAAAAVARPVPATGMGGEDFSFRLPGRSYTPGNEPNAVMTQVTPGYFGVLSIPFVFGRDFTSNDGPSFRRTAIVDRGFARQFFPGKDPIGKQILLPSGSAWLSATVVGVVGNVGERLRFGDLHTFYVPQAQRPSQLAQIVVRTAGPVRNLSGLLAAAVAAADPLEAVQSVSSLESDVRRSTEAQRSSAALVGILAAIAFLLALAGVYAIVSYSVEQRRHDIAIRMAMGARRSAVLLDVLAGAVRIGLVGVALGIVLAALGTRLVANLLFSVSSFDPVTFVAAIILVLASVVAAASIPGIRAATAASVAALRHE